MSEPSKKPLVILGIILTPPAALGGLFLGAMLFTRWQALKTPASLGVLPRYFAHTHQMSPTMHTAFIASCALAGIITLAPALMILVATFMKPKRELHGSARFANRAEIFQAGLLNKPKTNRPSRISRIAIGQIQRAIIALDGQRICVGCRPYTRR